MYKVLIFYLNVCNRGDTNYSITAGSRQGSLAKPLSLLFLTPRPALSSHQHRTLVSLFWSGNLQSAHLPANPTTVHQECFELLFEWMKWIQFWHEQFSDDIYKVDHCVLSWAQRAQARRRLWPWVTQKEYVGTWAAAAAAHWTGKS